MGHSLGTVIIRTALGQLENRAPCACFFLAPPMVACKAIDERLAGCLPSVDAVTVPGAAHAVHAQQPARFNELLVAFLTKHR